MRKDLVELRGIEFYTPGILSFIKLVFPSCPAVYGSDVLAKIDEKAEGVNGNLGFYKLTIAG